MSIKFLNGIDVDNGVLYTDTSNNRVGINTSSPQVPLEVKYTGTVDEIVRIVGTASGKPQVNFYNDTTLHTKIVAAGNNDFSITNTHSAGDMFFATGGSTRLHIESNGNVGIGTNSPSEKLDVRGNIHIEEALPSIIFKRNTSGLQEYSITNEGNFTIEKTTLDSGGSFIIKDENGKTPLDVSMGLLNPDIAISGDLFVKNKTGTTTNLYVQENNGYVGIGTTSPSDKLEVYNNGGDVAIRIHEDAGTHEAKLHLRRGGSDWELINNNNFTIESEDSEKFRITTTGNVGIGTTNPGVKLHIGPGTASSSTVEEFRIQTGVSGGYGGTAVINLLTGQYGNSGIYFGDQATYSSQPAFIEFQDSPSTLIYKAPVTSGSHVFKIGTSEQVRIAYNGYVGIGMSNPGAKLHVGVSSGSSSTTQEFRLQTQSGGYGGEAIINLRTGQYGTSGVYFGDGLSHTAQPAYIKFIDGSNSLGLKTSGSFSFITNTSTAMYLQSSGLGVGETSPTARLQVKESSITSFTGTGSSAQLRLRGGYTNNEYIILGFSQDANKDIGRMAVKRGSSGSSFHWGVSTNYGNGITNEAMVLTHQGYLGIKNLSPSYLLDVAGDGRVNGKLRCVTLIQTSQRDQKKDIADINKTKAKAIPFKEYKYKSSIDGSERKRYGVVAEDIENDYPELVHTGADGVKGINYIDLLVKRVAELEKELEDISLTPGPKGSTGATGPAGADGKNGANGNSHLSGVESIAFNEKTGQLEITIGKSTYRFNPAK